MAKALQPDTDGTGTCNHRHKWLPRLALVLLLGVFAFLFVAWQSTMSAPIIRQIDLNLGGIETDQPLRLVLLSDIHVSGPDMPPSRLEEIVVQINRTQPDIVLIAGDVVSDKRTATRHYSTSESVDPLAKLTARLGKIAVPGNHDHWRSLVDVRRELERVGFTVLQNEAVRIGPLTIGGLDDDFTHHADLTKTLTAAEALGGPTVLLSHSPDPFAELPVGNKVMLAGHTHCGQIRYPWGGTPATMSRFGDRYACGVVKERGNTLIVTAGIGTSVLPFRFLTRPDVWRVELDGGR